jgi:hypothetical protein
VSKIIPQRAIDSIREYVDISLDAFGINCTLYIPNNIEDVEPVDIYAKPSDYTFDHYDIQCHIEWPPTSVYRLKAFGMFTEGELPIIVYLPNVAYKGTSEEVAIDILRGSYINIPMQYIPDNFEKHNEFELTDIVIRNAHDAVLVKSFKAVPRRV